MSRMEVGEIGIENQVTGRAPSAAARLPRLRVAVVAPDTALAAAGFQGGGCSPPLRTLSF